VSRTDNWVSFLAKMPGLIIGHFLFAVGIVMNLYSNLGMAPWSVLQVGITNHVPLTLGQVSQLVGLVVLVIGWVLGFPPGFATVMNMYLIGYFIDLIMELGLVPQYESLLGEYLLLFGSVIAIGIGSYLYMSPKLGAGPRDGLMLGFVHKLNRPISQVRGVIEVTVLVLGYLMGGPVGVGTVVTALTVGISVQFFLRLGGYDRDSKHMSLTELARFLNEP
jgi:uncharacterized membrane protein YczE